MARNLSKRAFLSGQVGGSDSLTDTPYPIVFDPALEKGTFRCTTDGQMHHSSGLEWVPLAPPGTEMMIPPWVDVPEGWFEISGNLGGDFTNRRIIANLFDFGYVEGTLVSWFLPVAESLFETSAGQVQLSAVPSPVGLVVDATLPRVNFVQAVSGSRPIWDQVVRAIDGVDYTIDQITFNRLGQSFDLDMPADTSGTMFVCTPAGTYALGVSIPLGAYSYGRWDHLPVEEILINNKFLTATEIEAFKDFLVASRHRVKDDFKSVENWENAFRGRSEITSFPLIDLSGATSLGVISGTGESSGAWRDCSGLTFFPIINTSNVVAMRGAWRGCSGLTSFPLIDVSMVTDLTETWMGCSDLSVFPLIDTSNVVKLGHTWGNRYSGAWMGCSSLTQFPSIETQDVQYFNHAWGDCSSLTGFPFIDTGEALSLIGAWQGCVSMSNQPGHSTIISFPLIDTSKVRELGNNGAGDGSAYGAWRDCASFTVFPLIVTSACTVFSNAWRGCSGLTAFPLIDTSSGVAFLSTWEGCSGLTEFPLIDTSNGVRFGHRSGNNKNGAWIGCSGLTAFPLIDTSKGEDFQHAWEGCSGLSVFPALDFSSVVVSLPFTPGRAGFAYAWYECASLTDFPANVFNQCDCLDFRSAFQSCALTESSVNNILESIAAAAITYNLNDGVLDIDGGTSAAPSGAGASAKSALIARGWTVTTN